MNESRWQEIQNIFDKAVDLPPEQQRAAVAEMCENDEALCTELLDLLAEDGCANPLLDSSLDETARAMLDLDPLRSMVQKQIGPYRVLSLLGEGGMGVVYLAERTDIGGKVAIKLLRDAWLSPMRRQRFQLEQSTLAHLNHPSIARIYDSNTLEDGTPWFVMEYAEGRPLTDHWQQSGGSVRDCLTLFRRVCEAVQYAHSYAIIHRDLKPSNILVSDQGDVKLLDFGIAKHLRSEEKTDNPTVTGLRLMTPAYAAPEQITGSNVGVYTDVYALGVLLYELLTGRLPRQVAEKPSGVIRREKPDIRGQLAKGEWADLDVLVLKALEPDPTQRYRSTDALLRDLDALLAGRPLEARPRRLAYTAGKFARRNRRSLTALAAALVVLAATTVFYTVRLARARDAALREAARTLRIQQFTESLFDGGDADAGPAQDLKAVDLLDRGRREAASLGSDPEMQAAMQETLGGIYHKLGKLDMADPLLVSALDERRRVLGNENRQVAESLLALGLLRKDQGKLDEAESLERQAVAMNQRMLPRSNPESTRSNAKFLLALGSVLEVRGKYDEAKQVLESALNLQPQGSQATAQTSENLTELANVEFYQGHYPVSATLNHQALDIDRHLFGAQHPTVANELNNLGAIAFNSGDNPTSEAYYRQALAITEKWYGTDHPETAANLTALAQPITAEDRDAEAEALLNRALVIQKHVNGSISATVATTLNQLGIVAFRAKQWSEARSYFTQALENWRHLLGDRHQSVAVAYSNLGSVCFHEGDFPCAEKLYREALQRLDVAAPDSLNDAVAHVKLGSTLVREGRLTEAEPHSLAAYKYLVDKVPPSNGYLIGARKDLATIYDGLHDTVKAAQYRGELNLTATTAH